MPLIKGEYIEHEAASVAFWPCVTETTSGQMVSLKCYERPVQLSATSPCEGF